MTTIIDAPPLQPRAMLWTGRAFGGLVVLFLIFDSVIKLIPVPEVLSSMRDLGYPVSVELARFLGILLLICTALYVWPRTALLGAVLLTGYLGGAIATHVRVGNPLFTHTFFGIYLGLLIWGGLFLRDPEIRMLFPFRRS
ncbi:MAG: DoxX family protein [Pseudomonadota bacterium]|jgi:hypothetical protein